MSDNLELKKACEWISVKQALPEPYERVLACRAMGNRFTQAYCTTDLPKDNSWVDAYTHRRLNFISHWMYVDLPEDKPSYVELPEDKPVAASNPP